MEEIIINIPLASSIPTLLALLTLSPSSTLLASSAVCSPDSAGVFPE